MQSTLRDDQDTQELVRPPVFVDPSGRRRRALRYVALGVCALFACYAVVFVAALLGAPVPRSGLIPLPAAPAQPSQWQDPAQTEGPAPAGPSVGPSRQPGPSRRRTSPEGGEPAGTGSAVPRETVAVTPSAAPALTLERPNSNAAQAPPGLTKHTETRPGRDGR